MRVVESDKRVGWVRLLDLQPGDTCYLEGGCAADLWMVTSDRDKNGMCTIVSCSSGILSKVSHHTDVFIADAIVTVGKVPRV